MPNPEDQLRPHLGCALWSLFFNERKYAKLASQQDLCVNLRYADTRDSYAAGELENENHEADREALHAAYRRGLLKNLRGSAAAAALCGLIAFWISLYLNLPPLPAGKWLALASGLTGLWAGLIQMNLDPVIGDAPRLDQLISAVIVRGLVCIAAVLALLSGAMP